MTQEALKLALDKKADNARELGLDYEPENTLHWHALNYRTAPTQNAQAMFEALEKFVEAAIKEALAQPTSGDYALGYSIGFGDGHSAREALAQPEQEPNKDGSPCPEFWDWLPKAYNFDGNGAFTKYNMEVAFLAGKQASQPEQEPVAYIRVSKTGNVMACAKTGDFYSLPDGTLLYTTPPAGDIRALKHRIHALEGEVIGYKKIVADQDAMLERQTARIVDLQTHIDNFDGEDR